MPISLFLSFLENIMTATPITASTGVKLDGFKSFNKNTSPPSIPDRLNIHAVTVVPTFAPIMMEIVCESFMMPELTKPTSMTVVAEDD